MPGATVDVVRLFAGNGIADEWNLRDRLIEVSKQSPPPHLVVLSLSGYSGPLGALALADGIRAVQQGGTVVVASAGNDASCRPTIPASLPGVVSVGGIGPGGPAPFSNYGPWVRACAPAVDLVSTFFDGLPATNSALSDLDDFKGWARWSGTSFAAPAVAAALLRELLGMGEVAASPANGGPAAAVARVVDEPALFRLSRLGTVVNIA
jgi:subtilisin family serine protease